MGNEAEIQPSFSVVPMKERTPKDFEREMERLWVKHFGPKTDGNTFFEKHLSYKENKHFIYAANVALEESGKMTPIESVEDMEKPFRGIAVCTVGGVEGRVMAEMGADVVNISPDIVYAPKLDLPNLTEIPKPLDETLSGQYAERFDMVLSSGLMDRESDFANGVDEASLPEYCRNFMQLMLNLMKKEGLGVLRGNLVNLAVRQVLPLVHIKEIVPYTHNEKTDSADVIFIIQKK